MARKKRVDWSMGRSRRCCDRKGALRRLLQGYLDLRAHRERRHAEVKGSDGVVRSHCRPDCERGLMSLFGEVTVRRLGYGARGGQPVSGRW